MGFVEVRNTLVSVDSIMWVKLEGESVKIKLKTGDVLNARCGDRMEAIELYENIRKELRG